MISKLGYFLNRSLFLLFISAFFIPQTYAQIVPGEGIDSGLGGGNILSGSVLGPTGQRISTRITIRLSTMMRGDRVSSTDEKGNFIFRGLPSGTYQIIIDKETDYEPFKQTVEIMQLRGSPPQTYNLSIRLVQKTSNDAKPGVLNAAFANLPERGRQLYEKADELKRAGNHSGAIEQLLLLTSEFPKFMHGFNELGVEYLRMNELEKAQESFHRAIDVEPEAFPPLMNLGVVLVRLKKYGEAEPVLRNALKNSKDSAPAHYFLGQALANLGRFDEAEKELTLALAQDSSEISEAHRILAIIYSSRGDKERAAKELETYLQVVPNAPDAEKLRNIIKQLKNAENSPVNRTDTKPTF